MDDLLIPKDGHIKIVTKGSLVLGNPGHYLQNQRLLSSLQSQVLLLFGGLKETSIVRNSVLGTAVCISDPLLPKAQWRK